MSADEEMSVSERRKYIGQMKKRYVGASRGGRGLLLDEMEAVLGMHRKSLIRLLNGSLKRRPRQRGRGCTYGPEVREAVRVIAESCDHVCAERLTPNLPWLATHLEAHGELEVSPCLVRQLGEISVSTVARILRGTRRDRPRLPRGGPERAHWATRGIPMKRIPWDIHEPGHFETDLVHHCGPSASGNYVHTLQMIDVTTTWSERRAVLGRGYVVMEDAFRHILACVPFPVLEIHPDNGSEFFNDHLLRFWPQAVPGLQLSRTRPYHKNDNPLVEQKNSTLVRAFLGYDRLDTVAQTRALNRLYDRMGLYYNFFQPVMRLTEKSLVLVAGHVTRVKRSYDDASTPFDRLCATSAITPQRRQLLAAQRDRTNPRQLRQEIYDMVEYIFSLPGAVPGIPENVYLTLTSSPGLQALPGYPLQAPDAEG